MNAEGSTGVYFSSLCGKRFRGVRVQRKTEERDYPPLFWRSSHFSRMQNAENLISRSFFTPQAHRNAWYTG